jgi:2-methylaconitate cis-trans-isomerase PrpF
MKISVASAVVDWGPTCGNNLAGVGAAAIESGLITSKIGPLETRIRIRLVRTGGLAVCTASELRRTVMSRSTSRDVIHGLEVTLIDSAVPTVAARAFALRRTGV